MPTLCFPYRPIGSKRCKNDEESENADTITDGINVSPSMRIGS